MYELASERLTADFVSTPTAEMPVNSSRCNTYINNVLAFPGIFRGALDSKAKAITEGMKLAASDAIIIPLPMPQLSSSLPIAAPAAPVPSMVAVELLISLPTSLRGKCVLFKRFGGVDAFPISLATQDTQEIIDTQRFTHITISYYA